MKITLNIPNNCVRVLQTRSKKQNNRTLSRQELAEVLTEFAKHTMGIEDDDFKMVFDEYAVSYEDLNGSHPCLKLTI